MTLRMYLEGEHYQSIMERDAINYRPVCALQPMALWFNHEELHYYIIKNFGDEGNEDSEDHKIYLASEDIRQIIAAIAAGEITESNGLFLNDSKRDTTRKKKDVTVFSDALEWLEFSAIDGTRGVAYQSNW